MRFQNMRQTIFSEVNLATSVIERKSDIEITLYFLQYRNYSTFGLDVAFFIFLQIQPVGKIYF